MVPRWTGAFVAFVLGAASVARGAAPDAWNGRTSSDALDKLWHEVPSPLRPAIEFEKLLLKVRSADRSSEWREEMEKFAKAPGDNPIMAGLRELAKVWLARVLMDEIDGALRKFYRREVHFPDSLEVVLPEIPSEARRDPWGEAWVYKTASPKGFTKLNKQRYQLGPARYPQLSPLHEAARATPAPRAWKITSLNTSGAKALELHSGKGQVAVVQPGGQFADTTLLYIGEGWTLLADTERLFTLSF
jgi:hypothetical protein